MEWYESEVKGLEEDTSRQILPANPALFYGSSSIRLWNTMARDLRSAKVVNRGFGGSTLAACVSFFDRLVVPIHPASLTLYAGDNDLADGRPVPEILESFRSLARKVEQRLGPIPFAFISVKPSPARMGIVNRIREFNAGVRAEIEKKPWAFYVNVFDAMLDTDGQPRKELYVADGLHVSRAGYDLWTALLEPYRNRLFIGSQPESNSNRLLSIERASGVPQLVQPLSEP